jgi:5-hydroxyisourate hydrolase
MAQSRPPITCHVLDTTVGLPAPNIKVTLRLYRTPADAVGGNSSALGEYEGTTNADGRVTAWWDEQNGSDATLQYVFESHLEHGSDVHCTLTFQTGPYWESKNISPFFPAVTIQFVTTGHKNIPEGTDKPHWHVPLLLGPYTYTTYRGS